MTNTTIRVETTIAVSQEKVMDFLLSPSRLLGLMPGLESVTDISEEPLSKIGTFHFTYKMYGVAIEGAWQVTHLDYPKQYQGQTSGGVTSSWTYLLLPMPQGTQVILTVTYQPPESVLAQVAFELVQKANQESAETYMENLKFILEPK